MKCVVCTEELGSELHEGVEVSSCPGGHGMWLDEGELRTIVERESQPRSAAEKEAAFLAGIPDRDIEVDTAEVRSCPVCGGTLEKVTYDETSGVVIDTCVGHGVWVDLGELQRIEAWIEGNQDELAEVRQRLDAHLARMNSEVDSAHAHARGPLGVFAGMWHYYRNSKDV